MRSSDLILTGRRSESPEQIYYIWCISSDSPRSKGYGRKKSGTRCYIFRLRTLEAHPRSPHLPKKAISDQSALRPGCAGCAMCVCSTFTIMPEDMGAGGVGATAVGEIVDVFIFHLPRDVMLTLHADIMKIWKWFKNHCSIAWYLNSLLIFLPFSSTIHHIFIFPLFSSCFLVIVFKRHMHFIENCLAISLSWPLASNSFKIRILRRWWNRVWSTSSEEAREP